VAVQSKRKVLLRLVRQQGDLRADFRRLHVTIESYAKAAKNMASIAGA
jgi:hypothetical protein